MLMRLIILTGDIWSLPNVFLSTVLAWIGKPLVIINHDPIYAFLNFSTNSKETIAPVFTIMIFF